MGQVLIRLPDSLHSRLKAQAHNQGVPFQQYLVDLLTRCSAPFYDVRASTDEKMHEQQADYASLLGKLGTATHEEIERALQDREPTEPEPGLTPELMERMHRLLSR